MEKFHFRYIGLLFIILMAVPGSAITRQESVIEFVDSTRISDRGFAETVNGDLDLRATVSALEIKNILNSEVNNSLDILYYFQQLQDSSGGFAPIVGEDPNLEATITAITGFQYLEINQSQYIQWEIYPFLNQTAQAELLSIVNGDIHILDLTVSRLQLWVDYILSASLLGTIPAFPIIELIDTTKSLQFANGSYHDFPTALASVELLYLLGDQPRDPDLAKKFILSFVTDNGAFAKTQDGEATLETTHQALAVLTNLMDLWQLDTRNDISRFVFDQQQARSGFTEVGFSSPSISATLNAVRILFYLDNLDELNAPDVLQEVGFISYPVSLIPVVLYVLTYRRFRND